VTGGETERAEAGIPAEPVLDLRVTGGRPTAEELAAVTAVLHAAVAEQAAAADTLVIADNRQWVRAYGFLRARVEPGRGAWRSF
jgi:hypothetical protein